MTALRCLPGVGPKGAQRMAYHLLERDRAGGRRLSRALQEAMDGIGHCSRCRTFSETETCPLCASRSRDPRVLCVVETPADALAIAQGTDFRGFFFVLMGHLSPLDGIGPEELGMELLERRLAGGEVEEVILATNATVEGEATAHFVSEMARERGLQVTRIAQGIPMGGELEYVDSGTLAHAFQGRREFL